MRSRFSPHMSRADDLRDLRLLDLIDGEGMTFGEAGEAMGMTRSAVAGRVKRLRDHFLKCDCQKPENRDGGMARRWWKK